MRPQRIDRYEILDELGHGALGAVYLGRDPVLERPVVIRLLPSQLASTFQFQEELRQLARLNLPGLVPIYNFGVENQQAYIITRLMQGGSLADRLRQGPLAETEAARIIAGLAYALDEVHRRGIVHRDLKPGNILFDEDGHPYISDFGIIKLTESNEASTGSSVIGTPAYMSPEQVRSAKIDGRSDIYALGVILFEMLTGTLPYVGSPPLAVALKHTTEPVPRLSDFKPGLSRDYDDIIARAMAKDPEARYTTAGALATAVSQAAGYRERQMGRPSPPSTPLPSFEAPMTSPLVEPEPLASTQEAVPIAPDSVRPETSMQSPAEVSEPLATTQEMASMAPESAPPPAGAFPPILTNVLNLLLPRRKHMVSTGFAVPLQADRPLPLHHPLQAGQPYYFWLEVGEAVRGSIETKPTPLPVEKLPPQARLTVTVFAFEGEIEIASGGDVGVIQLQADGSVVVLRQPAERYESITERRLFFPVRTPEHAGVFRLRCNIYYEQTLVQSRLVHARVSLRPDSIGERILSLLALIARQRVLRSTVDYTLSQRLDPAHLDHLSSHRLSLMLNDNGDGTHGFRFFGADQFKSDANFDGQELQDLIQQARGALRLAAWGDEGIWQRQTYRYSGPLDLPRLTGDLIRFAVRGYRFYDQIVNRLAGDARQAERLAQLMRPSGRVQIALKESARHVLPAALIYDCPLDTGLHSAEYTLCQEFLRALTGTSALEECRCFQGNCPNWENDRVVCPSGFWGYRHMLGLPLSVGKGADVAVDITYQDRLEFTVGVSTDPAFSLRPVHEQTLQHLRPDLGWNYAATRDLTLRLLKETRPHLVYFYCHGGLANNVPYIQVGTPSEHGITRDNLRAKKIRWDTPRPLVFINGCHTAALEPEQALEFISAFIENAQAAGVIGTEITVFEPLACAFAEEFMRRFIVEGQTIGQAVRGARLALLKNGNPLGLAYIPFVVASLRLIQESSR